jgi:hypothetical protein
MLVASNETSAGNELSLFCNVVQRFSRVIIIIGGIRRGSTIAGIAPVRPPLPFDAVQLLVVGLKSASILTASHDGVNVCITRRRWYPVVLISLGEVDKIAGSRSALQDLSRRFWRLPSTSRAGREHHRREQHQHTQQPSVQPTTTRSEGNSPLSQPIVRLPQSAPASASSSTTAAAKGHSTLATMPSQSSKVPVIRHHTDVFNGALDSPFAGSFGEWDWADRSWAGTYRRTCRRN